MFNKCIFDIMSPSTGTGVCSSDFQLFLHSSFHPGISHENASSWMQEILQGQVVLAALSPPKFLNTDCERMQMNLNVWQLVIRG